VNKRSNAAVGRGSPAAHYGLAQIYASSKSYADAIAEMKNAIAGASEKDLPRYNQRAAKIALSAAEELIQQRAAPADIQTQLKHATGFAAELRAGVAYDWLMIEVGEREAYAVEEPARKVAKVEEALGRYDAAVVSPSISAADRALLFGRSAEACMKYASVVDGERKRQLIEAAIARADKSVEIAELGKLNTRSKAEALYIAGVSRVFASNESRLGEVARGRYRREAGDALRRANSVAPDHPDRWKWSNALGQLLFLEATHARTNRDDERFEMYKREGLASLEFAARHCPVIQKQQIDSMFRRLLLLKYEDAP